MDIYDKVANYCAGSADSLRNFSNVLAEELDYSEAELLAMVGVLLSHGFNSSFASPVIDLCVGRSYQSFREWLDEVYVHLDNWGYSRLVMDIYGLTYVQLLIVSRLVAGREQLDLLVSMVRYP